MKSVEKASFSMVKESGWRLTNDFKLHGWDFYAILTWSLWSLKIRTPGTMEFPRCATTKSNWNTAWQRGLNLIPVECFINIWILHPWNILARITQYLRMPRLPWRHRSPRSYRMPTPFIVLKKKRAIDEKDFLSKENAWSMLRLLIGL